MNDGYVNISPEELLRVSSICLEQHKNYNGEDDIMVDYYNDFILFRKKESYKLSPRWTYTGVGIQSKLLGYINIAKNKINDLDALDKDIKLSLTMYSELFKLLNKDEGFEPYVFGR